ncbi:MAG TPA: methyltransferase [Hyphomicrobiaceae bacterium]|nr:methyltransferase [Hyphomicrobiaceae bacterium]
MSRWSHDPERAASDLVERCLDALGLRGRVLLANQACHRPAGLAGRGLELAQWNRRLVGTGKAAPWPPAGPFEVVLLRLPKAKDEQEMAAHACLSVLAPDGRLVVYGGNEEGIRSAAAMLEGVCGPVETLAKRGHGRVLAVVRPAPSARLRSSLSAWRATTSLEIGGQRRQWISYPGVFAAGRVDEGTRLLIGALPPLGAGARVLDYGCGSGLIGAAALDQSPTIALDALDNDSVALEAARQNLPSAHCVLGTSLGELGASRYDAILSNPPLRQGLAEDHTLLEHVVAVAPAHLRAGGVLQIVVQRRVPLERRLAQHFASVAIAAENGRYRVWRAYLGAEQR